MNIINSNSSENSYTSEVVNISSDPEVLLYSNSSENSYTSEVVNISSDPEVLLYRLDHLLIEQSIWWETTIRDICYTEAER